MKAPLAILAGAGTAAMVGLVSPEPARALDYVLTGTGTVTTCSTGPQVGGGCPTGISPPAPFTFSATFSYSPFALTSGQVTLFSLASPAQPITLDPTLTTYNGSTLVLAGATTSGETQFLAVDLPAASLPNTIGNSQNFTDTSADFSTCNSEQCKNLGNQRLIGTANVSFTVTAVPASVSLLAIAPLVGVLGGLRKRYQRV